MFRLTDFAALCERTLEKSLHVKPYFQNPYLINRVVSLAETLIRLFFLAIQYVLYRLFLEASNLSCVHLHLACLSKDSNKIMGR